MVEYGADLHTMDHGSGFPTLNSKNLSKEDEVYAKVFTYSCLFSSFIEMLEVSLSK